MSVTKYCKINMANLTSPFHVFQGFFFIQEVLNEGTPSDSDSIVLDILIRKITIKNRVSLKENADLFAISSG